MQNKYTLAKNTSKSNPTQAKYHTEVINYVSQINLKVKDL